MGTWKPLFNLCTHMKLERENQVHKLSSVLLSSTTTAFFEDLSGRRLVETSRSSLRMIVVKCRSSKWICQEVACCDPQDPLRLDAIACAHSPSAWRVKAGIALEFTANPAAINEVSETLSPTLRWRAERRKAIHVAFALQTYMYGHHMRLCTHPTDEYTHLVIENEFLLFG